MVWDQAVAPFGNVCLELAMVLFEGDKWEAWQRFTSCYFMSWMLCLGHGDGISCIDYPHSVEFCALANWILNVGKKKKR